MRALRTRLGQDDRNGTSRLIWAALLTLLLTIVMAPLARAATVADDDFKDIFDALDKKDYASAWEDLRPLMVERNARAFFVAAVLTENGQGVEADASKAVELYRKGAEGGFDPAMNNLGVSLRDGTGVQKDAVEALKWFEKATRHKNDSAALNAGVAYVNGEGTQRDYVEAYAHYALSTDPQALKNMAELEQKVLKPEEVARARQRAEQIRGEANETVVKAHAEAAAAAANGTLPITLGYNDAKSKIVVTAIDTALLKELFPGMEDCGIRIGDELDSVDGKSAAHLTPEQAAELLKGPVDSNIQLTFSRDGKSGNVQISAPRVAARSTPVAAPAPAPAPTARSAPIPAPASIETNTPTTVPAVAVAENPLKHARPLNPLGAGATATNTDPGTFSDSDGRWSITVPTDWTRSENAAEKSVTFTHPSGAAIRVRLVSVANPFKNRYEVSACDRGLKWLGNVTDLASSSSDKPLGNVKACLVRFTGVEDGVTLLGKGYYAISGGEGLVIRLTVPTDQGREMGAKLDEIANTLRIAAP